MLQGILNISVQRTRDGAAVQLPIFAPLCGNALIGKAFRQVCGHGFARFGGGSNIRFVSAASPVRSDVTR
jgi:hypothetical protein